MFFERRGWSEAANTWEPVENLLQCSDILDAFEERFFFSSYNCHVYFILQTASLFGNQMIRMKVM